MLAAKSERDAVTGTLLFNAAHYALRPWPWIIVALASMIVFPQLADIQRAIPHVDARLIGHDLAYPAMLTFLPAGLLGLMVAGLTAAYVSTMSTHLNWGTSYLVHDFYRRFLSPGRSERHYVMAGRVVTALMMIVAALFTLVLDTARDSFNLLLSIGAGTGLLYLLRWFWWRVNAWAEIAAMACSFALAIGLAIAAGSGVALDTHLALLLSVVITTAVWVVVAWVTPPTDQSVLCSFYRAIRPAGPGWSRVRVQCGEMAPAESLSDAFSGWIFGCVCVYAALFGSGYLLFGRPVLGLVLCAVAVVTAILLRRTLRKLWG
jgi:Na+/proline symporter